MIQADERIDIYIHEAAPFARPVLERLRTLIHKYCPDVRETIKWGCPHFEYKAKILFSMAAFKQHCACGFRLASVMSDPGNILQSGEKTAMGNLGRIGSVKDLPSEKILAGYIREAMLLTEKGVLPSRPKAVEKADLGTPADLLAALKKNKKAIAAFEKFPPSHRREYIEWITEAKKPETREKRILTTIEWLEEGRSRNWKYER